MTVLALCGAAERQAAGRGSSGTFLAAKKSIRIKKRRRIFFLNPSRTKFDFDTDPDSDFDLDKQIKRCAAMVKTVSGQQ
ncbi:MAG: hypothetical protein ACOZBW_05935 [Thermodesulfobacteriota bacterium]